MDGEPLRLKESSFLHISYDTQPKLNQLTKGGEIQRNDLNSKFKLMN